MYEIVNVQYTGTYNNGGTSIPAVLGEFRASSAADLPAQNVDCHIICGCDGLDIATGDRYIWNGTAWILQPSDRAFSNVYTKPEIDSMITEIYDVIAYYHTTIVSDTGEITFYALAGYIGTWKIYGNGQQTGTPTPDSPIMPEFVGTLVGTDWTIPITCAGQTTPVYLGEVPTVRRVKKLVLTGEEEFTKVNSGDASYFRYVIDVYGSVISGAFICTHFQQTSITTSTTSIGANASNSSTYGSMIVFRPSGVSTMTTQEWKSYLAAQYANGTPVIIWYVLLEPETAIVNEPIAKIGTYADELSSTDAGVAIPTVDGENTLTVDTTLKPSKIEISGER